MDSSSSGSISSSGGEAGNEQEYTSPHLQMTLSPLHNQNHDQYPNFLDPFSPSLNPNPPFSNFLDTLVPFLNRNLDDTALTPWSSTPHFPANTNKNNPQTVTLLPPPMSVPTSNVPPRVPKKRSRASRRPATTVLTTDTSNFRMMVQEFTGFPAPPFVPASPFVRPCLGNALGLFQPGSNDVLVPSYLLSPFSHKMQNNTSSIVDAIASIARSSGNLANVNTMFAAPNATSTSSPSSNTNFVNTSTASSGTTSSVDPTSNFGYMQSHQPSNNKYNFTTQGDLVGMVGSDLVSLGCKLVELDKSRLIASGSETCTTDKGLSDFLKYADPKEVISGDHC